MFTFKTYVLFLAFIFQHACEPCCGTFDTTLECVELNKSGEIEYYSRGGSECWRILNPKNKMVTLNILRLEFEKSPCHLNYLTIEREGDASIKTLCSYDSLIPFYITSESSVEMKYRAEPTYMDSKLFLNYEIRDIRCSDGNVFRCSNLTCISRFKICDGERDCINGADERNCTHYEDNTWNLKARPTILRDCIEFMQEEEDNSEKDENWMQKEIINGTLSSEHSNSSQVLNEYRKKVKKIKVASITAKAADAVFAAKEAVRHFYENEEIRAREKHVWEKEKHAKEMELIQARIDSENKE